MKPKFSFRLIRRVAILCLLVYVILMSCTVVCPTRCTKGVCTPQPCQVQVINVPIKHK